MNGIMAGVLFAVGLVVAHEGDVPLRHAIAMFVWIAAITLTARHCAELVVKRKA
jgi:hypothetical protein